MRWSEQAEYSYDQQLGNIYVKLNTFQHPFENISLDPLGHIEVKAFNNARKVVKLRPLLVRCVDTRTVSVSSLFDFMLSDIVPESGICL